MKYLKKLILWADKNRLDAARVTTAIFALIVIVIVYSLIWGIFDLLYKLFMLILWFWIILAICYLGYRVLLLLMKLSDFLIAETPKQWEKIVEWAKVDNRTKV